MITTHPTKALHLLFLSNEHEGESMCDKAVTQEGILNLDKFKIEILEVGSSKLRIAAYIREYR